jgi:hypothetical protein
VKQNWCLIFAIFYNLIWYYHTLYPDTSIILIIALLSFVDHDGIANYGCHVKTCSRNCTMYKNNVLICISADDNYRLGGIQLHFKTLGCILRNPTWTQIDWAWRAHMSRQISNVRWRLGLKGTQKTLSDTKVTFNSFCIIFSKATTFTYEIRRPNPLT